jgi:hypothetical protein
MHTSLGEEHTSCTLVELWVFADVLIVPSFWGAAWDVFLNKK